MIYEKLTEQHLHEIVNIWNAELGASYPLRPRLLKQNVFADRRLLKEGSWAARESEGGELVGFVAVKRTSEGDESFELGRDLGWIHALFVAPNWRGQGIGGCLLRRAEEALAAAGVRRVQLGNDLHRRLFPGVPNELTETKGWFERRGYEYREDAYDLIRSYSAEERAELPDTGEATARIAQAADREELTAFMTRCFPGTWDLQQRDYWEQGGDGREYVVLERAGRIIGFCRMNDAKSPLLAQNVYWAPLFNEELGGIGPLGIDEAQRGHRYGISIVQAAIGFLRERGVRHIVIDTTPFVDFYGKLGYKPWRKYAKYGRSLAGSQKERER
ncbi:GNAT family N-acetyltransferase [Cohnella fermenti]|uniref:GNAT family N-acetyltransferase n=1 Tax=Cohnella fermenti TaxID=2565925 RepID=A0A4S4C672_9BACL|nr:GNAT family N-acetyltransferase [Cohnella fermenti]THF83390.1 GNAT family N-acetyltransferase [Cohnella fermenti]